jgi:hypothetical protein
MTDTSISIEKIEVSISGLSNETVKSSFANFDKEVALQAGKFLKNNQNGLYQFDRINVGNLQVRKDIQPDQLSKMIVERILKSIVQESL